jgi:hypothetical protein
MAANSLFPDQTCSRSYPRSPLHGEGHLTGAVPTVWLAVAEAMERDPERWVLQEDLRILIGGSALPEDPLSPVRSAWRTRHSTLGTY